MENQEYTPQICVSANDPVNSVKSLGGSIIGILFEKSGKEIRESIGKRLELIDGKVEEYDSMCNKTESFIEEKKKDLKELNEYHQDQMDMKKAVLLPIQTEIEERVKKANDIIYQYDLNIFNVTKEKAIKFEKGFDGIKKEFDDLDDLLIKDRAVIGSSGIQGSTGITGLSGETGAGGWKEPTRGIGFGGNVGIGVNTPGHKMDVRTNPGDKAYARLETLQNLLRKYTNKLRSLKDGINRLKEEKRRLRLTYHNIEEDRDYKLDLNMLSAFGFEDCK